MNDTNNSSDTDPVSYQCYDNGTLLVPVQIGAMNQTLTSAEEVFN